MTRSLRFAAAASALCAVAGCAMLGPASIKSGRGAYNDAIVATNGQQVLGMIVRMRYAEPSGLLTVSSVTANLSFQATTGAEFGIGSESSYAGNLTPLSAGIAFEENPTVSYAPVQGEKYIRQLLSPIPVDLAVLMLGALGDSPEVLTLLVKSVNGVRNPASLPEASVAADPRFARLAQLLAQMQRTGDLSWVSEDGELAQGSTRATAPLSRSAEPTHTPVALDLSGEGAAYEQRRDELLDLLGLTPSRDPGITRLPVRLAAGRPRSSAIQLQTRSIFELFQIAAASVQVPDAHLESGIAPPVPPAGAAERIMRIAGTRRCPGRAMIAVERHGWCYSIDAADTRSKLVFRLLESLLSARMAEAVSRGDAPVMTVPVSR